LQGVDEKKKLFLCEAKRFKNSTLYYRRNVEVDPNDVRALGVHVLSTMPFCQMLPVYGH